MLHTILCCILFLTCVNGRIDEVCFTISEDSEAKPDPNPYCTVGMKDKRIKDDDITASSSWGDITAPSKARLDNQINLIEGKYLSTGSWSSSPKRIDEWIQVDLHQPTRLTGVITQGRPGVPQWVTSFKISYGKSIDQLQVMLDNLGKELIFDGNTDSDSYSHNKFPRPVVARYVRLFPQNWHNWISLRMEYLTC